MPKKEHRLCVIRSNALSTAEQPKLSHESHLLNWPWVCAGPWVFVWTKQGYYICMVLTGPFIRVGVSGNIGIENKGRREGGAVSLQYNSCLSVKPQAEPNPHHTRAYSLGATVTTNCLRAVKLLTAVELERQHAITFSAFSLVSICHIYAYHFWLHLLS